MRIITIIIVLLFVFILTPLFGESNSLSFSVKIAPGINIPVGRDVDFYTFSGGVDVQASFNLPILPFMTVGADVGYNLVPLEKPKGTSFSSLSLLSGGAVIGANFEVLSKFVVGGFGEVGYFYALFNEDPSSGEGNPYVGAGLNIYYKLLPALSLGLESSYRNFLGLYNDMHVAIGTTFLIGPGVARPSELRRSTESKPEPLTKQGQGVEATSVRYDNIFPVFFKYYDKHPIGKATLKNWEEVPVENVQTSFFVKQYMDNPKSAKTIERLEPGEEKVVDIYGLFTNTVLDITEGTSVSALLSITYVVQGKEITKEYIETIRLENRNAVTWDDDRKACAFVTAKDPAVLKFAKNVAGIIKEYPYRGVDKNMVLAIALHETLDLYGITYVVDPTTPYVEFSESELAIDYLQFPKQTLEFTAGDCDDLSILYTALLEAVGVETAFVTIPGHIFVAFALAMTPDEARKQFLYPDDLIFKEDKAWLPVEITARNMGFVKAWETGAKEWRENASEDLYGFFPMHEGWELYEPVGFPGVTPITMPARDQVLSKFQNEVESFVEREISPRVKQLQAELERKQGDVRILNKIGVLYAKYGLYENALESFDKILSERDYVPALLNVGNIYFLRGEMKSAKSYFERAEKMDSDNPKILLCIAMVNHELENYGIVREAYDRLKEIAPEIAERFAYLTLRGEEASRAADLDDVKGAVLWDED